MLFSVPRRLGGRHWWGCRTANSRLAPAEVATRITASAVTLLNPPGRCEVGVAVPISVPRTTVEVYSETLCKYTTCRASMTPQVDCGRLTRTWQQDFRLISEIFQCIGQRRVRGHTAVW